MTHFLYVGSYTQPGEGGNGSPQGITVFRRNLQDGHLTFSSQERSNENPSFLRFHPTKRYLYAVNELVEGAISAFAVEPQTGGLTFLNRQPTRGAHPCYISFDPAGKFVLISNYSTGSLAVYPIQKDGSLAEMSDLIEHLGSGPHGNQNRAHAHSIAFDPSGNFVLAADLGMDRILVYRFDADEGKLKLNSLSGAATYPGSGPRHFAFNLNGKFLYSANELNSTVTTCTWDSAKGILVPVQVLSTLPEGFTGRNDVADIHLSANGKWLYISNRGHNSLAVYQILETGNLQAAGQVPTGGNWPRNFAVDPNGRWLYAANQKSNDLVTFDIGLDGGMPVATGEVIPVTSPVCIELVEL